MVIQWIGRLGTQHEHQYHLRGYDMHIGSLAYTLCIFLLLLGGEAGRVHLVPYNKLCKLSTRKIGVTSALGFRAAVTFQQVILIHTI